MTGWQQAYSDQDAYETGWLRTFGDIPQFDPEEKKMLQEWVENYQFGKVMLYLTEEKYRGLDEGMAKFILNELMEGNL